MNVEDAGTFSVFFFKKAKYVKDFLISGKRQRLTTGGL